MKFSIGRIVRAAAIGSLLLAGLAQAQITDINAAINKAGRERMLSQRMAKAYFQLGLGVDADRSKKVLDGSISFFDRQLVELKNFAPTPEIKDTYQKLETAWIAYKDSLVGAPPNPEGGKKVLALSEQVLALAHQGTVQLEKHSGSNAGRLVNISGRQRMLSQRMAKFYQALAWGVADANSAAELDKARKDFAAAHKELAAAPANTQQVKDGLELVNQQWFFFENSLNHKASGDKKLSTAVATTSERILEEMEVVVGLYERLPSR
ncbi:MAG: type IV pili methyl-accepting chemotaxis transducer N-terminal domain-containing protein [Rhodocyclales bacterium]|nr:type IV pili methyl-accepting chemotaxis transducer N-terminal domain-containing protein [Rhodocyclales bacterium]